MMVLAGEASYRLENRILGNDFGRRRCLYPLLLGQIFQKKQFLKKKCASTIFFWRRQFFFGVEKSKVANRLKRVFPKFEADRSHVRGVNASSKYIPLKYPPRPPKYFFETSNGRLPPEDGSVRSETHVSDDPRHFIF